MSRYWMGFTLASGLIASGLAGAGDGKVVLMREVPYQPVVGIRETGRVLAIDVAPDAKVQTIAKSMTGSLSNNGGSSVGGVVTELTDRESSIIAGGMGGNVMGIASGQQNTSAYDGLVTGAVGSALGSTLSPNGTLSSLTSSIGGSVGGSVGRVTDSLTNTLSGAIFRASGIR